jgi:hypothetical protein
VNKAPSDWLKIGNQLSEMMTGPMIKHYFSSLIKRIDEAQTERPSNK